LHHASAESGRVILDVLGQLKVAAGSSTSKISFPPCHRAGRLATLLLELVAPRDDLQVMHIACRGDQAMITVTEEGLLLLKVAFEQWLAGAEDFGVSPRHAHRSNKQLGKLDRESGELWFWGPGYSAP
jgi:hypothetical protein